MSANNPYQQLYRSHISKTNNSTTMQEAQTMATHMSLIYHAFGNALKDIVSLLSILYSTNSQSNKLPNTQDRQEKQHKLAIIEQQFNQNNIVHKQTQIKDSIDEISLSSQDSRIKVPDFNKYMIKPIRIQKDQNSNSSAGIRFRTSRGSQSQPINQIYYENKAKQIKRTQVVRGEKERQSLCGYTCGSCQKFFKLLGQDYKQGQQNKFCKDCSKHRSNYAPTNFFVADYSQQFGFDN